MVSQLVAPGEALRVARVLLATAKFDALQRLGPAVLKPIPYADFKRDLVFCELRGKPAVEPPAQFVETADLSRIA